MPTPTDEDLFVALQKAFSSLRDVNKGIMIIMLLKEFQAGVVI